MTGALHELSGRLRRLISVGLLSAIVESPPAAAQNQPAQRRPPVPAVKPKPKAATGQPGAVRPIATARPVGAIKPTATPSPPKPPAPAAAMEASAPVGGREALEEAYRKRPSVAVLLELAKLAEKDGLKVVAYDLRRRAAKVPTLPAATKALLAEEFAKGVPTSGEVLPSGLRKGVLYLDDRLVGGVPVGAPLLVEPGEHTLAVDVGANQRLLATVKVRAGVLSVLRWTKPGAPAEVWSPPLIHWLLDEKGLSAAEQSSVFVAVARGTAAHKLSLFGAYGHLAPVEHSAGCAEQASCVEELAQSQSLRYVIVLHAEKLPEALSFELRLFDAEIGQFAANQKLSCDGCTMEQAAPRLTTAINQLIATGKTRPTGLLEISSIPAGAEVLIDGRRLGVTPFRRSAWVGEHEVLLHKTGFIDYQNQVEVEGGRGAALDVTLKKEPVVAPPPPPPPPAQPPAKSRRGSARAASPAAKM